MQFNLLTLLGLRQEHSLLDIGCGSLRAGRLFIMYLLPDRYFGIEPGKWLIEEGIRSELGPDLLARKRPTFNHDDNFTCSVFGREFDFLIAQSIFSHAAPHQITRCLTEARKCMKPTSIFAATFVEGPLDYTGKEWVYPGCVTYRLGWMEKAAADAGLVCRRIEWFHARGQSWVIFARSECEPQLNELTGVNGINGVKAELAYYRTELRKLQNHPYVRVGMGVSRMLKRLKKR